MKKLTILFLIISIPFLSSTHGNWIEVSGNGKVGEVASIQLILGLMKTKYDSKAIHGVS